jgi:pimeloyl-ACP methyl ester carboxylesterase
MSNWPASEVIANGIRIHYHRTGGDRPPLVLSHGFSDNGMCWIRAARVLAGDYDVIMPDARGHGKSAAPDGGYATEDRAADLAALILALGLDRPALMGHSMGASTTAATAGEYPERVGCIVLEDPPWFGDDSPRIKDQVGKSPEELKAQAEQRRTEILERKCQTVEEIAAFGRQRSPTWDEIEFGPWAESKRQLSPKVVSEDRTRRTPWSEVVPGISCPTLLVIGDPRMQSIVTPEIARQAADMNPLIQVVQIDGAGHNIRREQFDAFMQAATEFLAVHTSHP